jgi:cytochrome b561
MGWKGDGRRYGAVAMAMHWATVAAILGLLGSGLAMERLTDAAARTQVLSVHAVMGGFVVLLTLLRIGWWLFADRRPAAAVGMPRWQAASAWVVHRLLYAAILVMGASGVATLALSGAIPILFGGQPGPLPAFSDIAPRAAHGLVAWLLVGLIAAHIGAALYHQLVLRDRLLGRMGLGRAG